ncbi:MAG: hypothetical protein G01um101433_516 [Parcubacteria group bacterium Gr01-1014_33]|nr:MAG: hypothetical protein G01um101433_516 [Parcubacteria group bacterium Gr01-1014_33]
MEILSITLTGWAAITTALSMVILAGLMFILGREKIHFMWGVFSSVVALWMGAFYAVTLAGDPETARFWWKIAYVGIILIPFTFLHFVLEFIGNERLNRLKNRIIVILYAIALVFLFLNLTTNLIIDKVTFLFDELYYNSPPASLHPYFLALFSALTIYAFYLVYREYNVKRDDTLFRSRVRYFFFALSIGYVGASMNFLAVYGIQMHPLTNLMVIIGASIVGYAILRHQLFNIRIVTAQLLTLILAGFGLFRLIVSASVQEMVFNVLLLAITLLVGVYLILSVRKEVEQRERLEVLSHALAEANEELKKLDAAKSEFVSIAGHQLRAPLTVIRGYVSMAMEGSFGAIDEKVKDALGKVEYSAVQLVKLVASLLDLSRIESGRIKYDFVMGDFQSLTEKVIEEFTSPAKKKGLRILFENRAGTLPQFLFDQDKMREVAVNLVDNAVKYSKEGEVAVRLEVTATGGKPHARLSVHDSGIGIKKEDIAKLFSKFARTEQAQLADPNGMGIGLYFVKRVVEDHGGKVWAESEGEGKGSTFFLEIPMRSR